MSASQIGSIVFLVVLGLLILAAVGMFGYSVWSKHSENQKLPSLDSFYDPQEVRNEGTPFELDDEELGDLGNEDADKMLRELRQYQS